MANNQFRLPSGGTIDRSKPIPFTFNGKQYQGYDGDTLASALLANGVHLTARSFKYHRPRGIVSAGVEEPASFVELAGEAQSANQPITTVALSRNLAARSVNCWPSPDFDVMAINQAVSRLLPAAFYYKTFMWPNWHLFEPAIRRAAGLATAPTVVESTERYENRHWHCDVLIVGAGPAGLMAALKTAESGARVVLVDEGTTAGGFLTGQDVRLENRSAEQWVASAVTELATYDNVVHLQNATAWGYREHNLVMVTERFPDLPHLRQRTWRIRAQHVILATGAIERPLVFPGNDRPGIMLASAVSTYINRYAVRPGTRAVLFTNNNSVYRSIPDLESAGIEIAAVVDARHDSAAADTIESDLLSRYVITDTQGSKRVRGVTVKSLRDGHTRHIECDLVCTSGGWNPTTHLFSQSRGTLRYDPKIAAFVADRATQEAICVGGASGKFTLGEVLADGGSAGLHVVEQLGCSPGAVEIPGTTSEPEYNIEPLWHVDQPGPSSKSFVDIQNDVTLNDIHLAIREGYSAVEHVKRYTTTGMGLDQGKTGNINAIGAIANATGSAIASIGITTFRSPYTPVEFGALSGLREESVLLPYRHTPITQWNIDHGATMYEAGARWRRPGYFPRPGESFQQTVNRECEAVRNGVAVYDGSPLGKFEIKGPDALPLLEMLYTNSFANLKSGMGRYGLMLTDDGLILDDGVTFKLGENHYLMSTSTGHADEVNRHMEHFLQIERPEWQVMLTTVTSQWSNATVCGPGAREFMQMLGTDIDLSPAAFPFMAMREGTVMGFPARVCRVSFTGELSFEINVYPRFALRLWDKIIAIGESIGLTPIGSESNHVLRVEKGFLSLGHEVDGTTDPYDLNMGWVMSEKKIDFIGRRAVQIRRAAPGPRRELVGLLTEDSTRLIPEGAPVTPGGRAEPSEGLVTACVWSVANNRSIALALLMDGNNRMGQQVHVRLKEEAVPARVTRPCFYDPEGNRLRS